MQLWRQTIAVVNRTDRRLTAGVGNCCKQSAVRVWPVYSDATQLDVELSCVAINGA